MKNREKLMSQLFVGKASEILGNEKTIEFLKECMEVFPKCKHNEGKDKRAYAGDEFIGNYCPLCEELYSDSI